MYYQEIINRPIQDVFQQLKKMMNITLSKIAHQPISIRKNLKVPVNGVIYHFVEVAQTCILIEIQKKDRTVVICYRLEDMDESTNFQYEETLKSNKWLTKLIYKMRKHVLKKQSISEIKQMCTLIKEGKYHE